MKKIWVIIQKEVLDNLRDTRSWTTGVFWALFGPLILGGALSVAGFDPSSPPSEVTPGVRQAVLLGIAYVPAAMAVVAVAILSFYRLDQRALEASRAVRVER